MDEHAQKVEQLEAQLRLCRQRIAELEQGGNDRTAAVHRSQLPPDDTTRDSALHSRSVTGQGSPTAPQERPHMEQNGRALHIFRGLVDHLIDGVCVAAIDMVIYHANAAFRRMSGYGDRAIGIGTLDLVDEETRMRIAAELQPAIAANGRWEGTAKLCRPDGSFWMAQVAIVPLRDEGGVAVAHAAIYRDVTEQLRQEKAMRDSEARHRALVEAIPDLMFVITTDEVFVDYKAEHDSELYAPPEYFLGRKLQDVLPPDVVTQARQALQELARTQKLQIMEYSLAIGENKLDYEGRLIACGDNHVLLIIRNITARKQAEKERLALHARMLEAKEAALRELATPVIPIADGVIAMPLIGTIDPVRAEQILEALLAGVASQNVKIAILDITGVKVVDAAVAKALLQTAQAARLLGAEVVLTGVRPHVARTLVELGADMGGIVTRSTLKAGIAYALR